MASSRNILLVWLALAATVKLSEEFGLLKLRRASQGLETLLATGILGVMLHNKNNDASNLRRNVQQILASNNQVNSLSGYNSGHNLQIAQQYPGQLQGQTPNHQMAYGSPVSPCGHTNGGEGFGPAQNFGGYPQMGFQNSFGAAQNSGGCPHAMANQFSNFQNVGNFDFNDGFQSQGQPAPFPVDFRHVGMLGQRPNCCVKVVDV